MFDDCFGLSCVSIPDTTANTTALASDKRFTRDRRRDCQLYDQLAVSDGHLYLHSSLRGEGAVLGESESLMLAKRIANH